eukprot:TRINITY_DN24994_c0_g1_i1.p1 TRINITY_DN24994_c0_g1~~TRINITY_DN24994_c0_g1_i1.p1  ORF type:complete len:292 (+),score=20.36 TRINITY_DN24994_c0_g1_i1:50-925(+)
MDVVGSIIPEQIPADLTIDILVVFGLAAASYPKLYDLQRQTRSIGCWHSRLTWGSFFMGYISPLTWCWALYTQAFSENIFFLFGFVMLGNNVLIQVLPRLPPTEVLIDFQFCHCLWTGIMQLAYCAYVGRYSHGMLLMAALPTISHAHSLWNQEHTYFNVSSVRAAHHTAILFSVVSLLLLLINIADCCPEVLSPPHKWASMLPTFDDPDYSIPTVSSVMRYYRWAFLGAASILSIACVYLWRVYTSYIVQRIIKMREEQDAEDGAIPGVNSQDAGTAKRKKLTKRGRVKN